MEIFSDQNNLYINFTIIEKILGIHWSFQILLRDISGIHCDVPQQTWKELRLPGTFIPGMIKAGTYLTERGWEFWYVTRKKHHVTIDLRRGFYKRMVLSADDKDTIEKIKERIGSQDQKLVLVTELIFLDPYLEYLELFSCTENNIGTFKKWAIPVQNKIVI